MKSTLSIFLSSLLFLSGCSLFFDQEPRETPEPALPEVTSEGANTFGCKIDGEVYIPFSCNLFLPGLSGAYGSTSNLFSLITIQKSCDNSTQKNLAFDLGDFVLGDTMWLGDDNPRHPVLPYRHAYFADFNQPEEYVTWNEDSTFFSGWVHIHDMNLEIGDSLRFVAGTFEFTARDIASNQEIEVTEGRFDIALNR